MKPWKSAREIKKSATSTMNWYIKYHWHPLGRTFYELVPIFLRRKIKTVFSLLWICVSFSNLMTNRLLLTLTLGISIQFVRERPFDGATTRDESLFSHNTQNTKTITMIVNACVAHCEPNKRLRQPPLISTWSQSVRLRRQPRFIRCGDGSFL